MAKPRKAAAKSNNRAKSSQAGSALSQKSDLRSRNVAGAILSQQSKASQTARRVERTFEAGVASALRIARARGVAVTIQDKNGKLVRGIPHQRDGAFVIGKAVAKGRSKDSATSIKGTDERGRKR